MARYRLIEFAELDSTNRYAIAQLAELAHGDVIQAAVQTAGRGRLNRSWISHIPGNLCLSLVLKPEGAPVDQLPLANLSQLLALSACRVLDSRGVATAIKWPNDIQIRDRKVAGILAETMVRGAEFFGVVLGIGVNLNLDAKSLATIDQPATSLSIEVNHAVGVTAFRDALLEDFFDQYEEFLRAGFRLVREEFLGRCHFFGQPVEVRSAVGVCRGTALDINQHGALLLRDTSGQAHVITVGEMFPGVENAQS